MPVLMGDMVGLLPGGLEFEEEGDWLVEEEGREGLKGVRIPSGVDLDLERRLMAEARKGGM
jgi:hypothetical protein